MSHTRTSLARLAAQAGFAFLTGVGVLTLTAGQPPMNQPAANSPSPSGIVPASQSAPAVQPQVEPAAQLIADAKLSFSRVKDYMGTLVKEERVGGQLQPEQYIAFRIRQKPYQRLPQVDRTETVRGPGGDVCRREKRRQVAGKGDRPRRRGRVRVAGPDGPAGDEAEPSRDHGHRHRPPYRDDRPLPRNGAADCRPGQVQTPFREFVFQQKPCMGMETVHKVNNGQFYCYRSVVYFDKQTKLPVRFEAYDWPTAGGPAGGEKLECYSYIDLKYNVGLTDAAFGQ